MMYLLFQRDRHGYTHSIAVFIDAERAWQVASEYMTNRSAKHHEEEVIYSVRPIPVGDNYNNA